MIVLEFDGHDELYETAITVPGATNEHTPEYKGKVDEQLCNDTRVVLIDSNANTVNKTPVMQWFHGVCVMYSVV
jgi:hypothetical protein